MRVRRFVHNPTHQSSTHHAANFPQPHSHVVPKNRDVHNNYSTRLSTGPVANVRSTRGPLIVSPIGEAVQVLDHRTASEPTRSRSSSMTTLQTTAVTHLRMLQHERNPAQDALYVRLAYIYGVQVTSIADASGLPVTAVQNILGGH
jgi:hypothetical protein